MRLGCSEIFSYCFAEDLLLSLLVKEFLKNRLTFGAKLYAKVEWHVFPGHGVFIAITSQHF